MQRLQSVLSNCLTISGTEQKYEETESEYRLYQYSSRDSNPESVESETDVQIITMAPDIPGRRRHY